MPSSGGGGSFRSFRKRYANSPTSSMADAFAMRMLRAYSGNAADINVDGKRVAIVPGMAVNAEIITGDRRVIDYLLSPILRYRHESARER